MRLCCEIMIKKKQTNKRFCGIADVMTDTVRAVSSLVVNKTNAGVQREHFTTWGGRAATNLKHKLTELV